MQVVLDKQAQRTRKREIPKHFNRTLLSRISLGRNTNKVENVSATLSKTLPKGGHFQRTISGQAPLMFGNNELGSNLV